MKFKIQDQTKNKIYHSNKSLIQSFLSEVSRKLFLKEDASILFREDEKNSKKFLGRTAHYDPTLNEVSVFCTNRHGKDILRSISHELVHHHQNENGALRNIVAEDGYAQKNEGLRKLEEEAFLKGNMIFRDWEDGYKKKYNLHEQQSDPNAPTRASQWYDKFKTNRMENGIKKTFDLKRLKRLGFAIAAAMKHSGISLSSDTAHYLNQHQYKFGTSKEHVLFNNICEDYLQRLNQSGRLWQSKWLVSEIRKQTIIAMANSLPWDRPPTNRMNASPKLVNEHLAFLLNAMQSDEHKNQSSLKMSKNPIIMERTEKLANRIFDGLILGKK